jgi:hypothetical protein
MTNNINKEIITLDTIRDRKDEVLSEIRKDKKIISRRWEHLFAPAETHTKGEQIMNIIDNSFAIYDGTMMGLKLMRRFRGFFSHSRNR